MRRITHEQRHAHTRKHKRTTYAKKQEVSRTRCSRPASRAKAFAMPTHPFAHGGTHCCFCGWQAFVSLSCWRACACSHALLGPPQALLGRRTRCWCCSCFQARLRRFGFPFWPVLWPVLWLALWLWPLPWPLLWPFGLAVARSFSFSECSSSSSSFVEPSSPSSPSSSGCAPC